MSKAFNHRLKRLGQHYHLELPTTTSMWKAGASKAASTLDSQGVYFLSKQMTHSDRTAERWYQLKDASTDSVEAYKTIEGIREGGKQKNGEEKEWFGPQCRIGQ